VANALERITHNWQLKLTAVVLAFLFWAALRREQPYSYTFRSVPVRVQNEDPEWVLASSPDPNAVRVTLEGPGGELLQVASNPPEVRVPIGNVTDSSALLELQTRWVHYDPQPGTRVVRIEPLMVRLAFERVNAKLLPLVVDVSGTPAPGFMLAGPPVVEPAAVRASGGAGRLARIDSLHLPLNLDNRRGVDTLEVQVDTARTGLVFSPARVRVIVSLRPLADSAIGMMPEVR
jgi:YbbR domain-containing protein